MCQYGFIALVFRVVWKGSVEGSCEIHTERRMGACVLQVKLHSIGLQVVRLEQVQRPLHLTTGEKINQGWLTSRSERIAAKVHASPTKIQIGRKQKSIAIYVSNNHNFHGH